MVLTKFTVKYPAGSFKNFGEVREIVPHRADDWDRPANFAQLPADEEYVAMWRVDAQNLTLKQLNVLMGKLGKVTSQN